MTFKTDLDIKGLNNLLSGLKQELKVKVGVLGGKEKKRKGEEEAPTLAFVGQIQEFGSVSKKIPKRSFIREPLQKHLKKKVEQNKDKIKKAIFDNVNNKVDVKKAYELLGIIAQSIIQESFHNKNDGKWPRNKPSTIARKGFDNPLIDTGRLSKSITYKVVKK
mgnify:CR=1 FL=1